MDTSQTILHPTDFSEAANFAFRLAVSLARDHQARLVIVHVAPTPYAIGGEIMVAPPEPASVQREELLDRLHEMKPSAAEVEFEHRLYEGNPAEEILRAAEASSADLIVMGTHGRTGLSRLLMGSVAEQVVRRASCPVLTVKTPVEHKAKTPRQEEAVAAR